VNNHNVNNPTAVSAINIAQKTPMYPIDSVVAMKYERGISSNQKKKKFILVGVIVSPAPLKACDATIHHP
jgi:hypothetical protein